MMSSRSKALRGFAGVVCGTIVAICGSTASASQSQQAGQPADKKAVLTEDTLIFKDGRVYKGSVISETDAKVRFKGSVGGIPFETEYNRSDILSINRGTAAKATDVKAPNVPSNTIAAADPGTASGAKRVYVIPLTGEFGEDISQKPIAECLKDARDNRADIVVFSLENKWAFNALQERKPEDAEFDSMNRAEEMQPVLTRGTADGWASPPRTVMYVRQALGGASFLPLLFNEVYFSPNARMGGIGDLSLYFQGSDENARQKQISLRMGRAKGMASIGGHPLEIVDAMAIREYVLSYTYENGKVVLLPRMPEGPNEFLLTDDGKDDRKDDIRQVARGEGNDALTLNAKTAQDIGFSKGTVDELDELFFQLGAGRNPVRVDARAEQIMKRWSDDVARSKRRLKEIIEEYARAQQNPGGTYEERTRQRGVQRRCLNEIKSIYRNFGEGIGDRWRGQNGMPPESEIEALLKDIELKQALDRK